MHQSYNHTVSSIRLVSMLMIISCHIFQYYDHVLAYVLNVGVQVFLVMSGYLYGTKKIDSVKSFYIKSFKKILVPYYVFLIFAICLYYFRAPQYLDYKKVVLSFLTVGNLDGLGHLWFIKYILLCYLLVPILVRIRDRINTWELKYFAYVCVLTMIVVEFILLPMPLLGGMPVNCFVFGFFFSNFDRCGGRRTLFPKVFVACAVCINIFRVILISNNYKIIGFLGGYCHFMFGAALFIFLLSCLDVKKTNNLLSFSDKYSYHIYLVHTLCKYSLIGITSFEIINIPLIYICSGLSGVLLYKVTNLKLLDKLTVFR